MSVNEQRALGGGGSEIVLRDRKMMSICGVEEVLNFDEDGARLKCVDGELFIEGREIKIDALDTQKGIVAIRGYINGMYYAQDEEKKKSGFLGRMLR